MINYLYILCHENKNHGKSIFSFSIYHESQLANTLDLPNDNRLDQSSLMLSSAQLHIPHCKNKKHAKAKSIFFTFDLCSNTTNNTMNEYCKNKNPASEHHLFYLGNPLSLS